MGTSAAKIAANRRNAAKSTGPKTLAGKKASAMNATRHALLAVAPVLPGIEKAEDWEAHRSGTLASLAPVGYLETVLAGRVAELLWRLGRLTRYETENTASKLETVEANLEKSLRLKSSFMGKGVFGNTPTLLQEELTMRTKCLEGFRDLHEMGEEEKIPPEAMGAALSSVALHASVDFEDVKFSFLPPEADELEWDEWDGWTKASVLQAVDAILAVTKKAYLKAAGADEAWQTCADLAKKDVRVATEALREAEARLQRSVRARVLLSAKGLEKVARYETHLERSLYRALHEIQRMQAARNGAGGTLPMALDVDVSVVPRAPGPKLRVLKERT